MSESDRRKIKIIIPFSILLSSLDLLGVILLGTVGTLAFKLISKDPKPTKLEIYLQSIFPKNTSESKLALYVAILAIIVLSSKTLSQAIFNFKMTNFLARIETEISTGLFRRILISNVNAIQSYKYNDYQFSLLVGASRMCIGVINNFIMLVTDLVITFFMGCLAFYASKSGFLISFLIIFSIYFLVNKPVQSKAREYGSKLRSTQLALGNELLENISGIKELKTYAKEQEIFEEFLDLKKDHSVYGQKAIWLNTLVRYFLEIAILLIGFFLILFLSLTTDIRHAITIVVVFMSIGFRLIPNIQRIQNAFVTFKMSKEMTRTLFELDDHFIKNEEKVNLRLAPPDKEIERIISKNLSFKYADAEVEALAEINFELAQGKTLVIVGKSGSGKTTLADLIAGLNTPTSGSLNYEFSDPHYNSGLFRPSVSYVSQGSSLYGSNIYQNIALSSVVSDFEKYEIDRIAEEFNLDFLRKFDSVTRNIRSDGTNLSGGERQRVALARSRFQKSRIVIFDEPTSSLDSMNTKIVTDYIMSLHGKSTVIIVTHSLDLLNFADYVLELEHSQMKFFGDLNSFRGLSKK